MYSVLRSLYKTITLSIPFMILKLAKLSSIIGLRWTFFNLNTMVMPAIGAHISISRLLSIFSIRTCIHILTTSSLSAVSFLYYLPSLCGAFYFKTLINDQASLIQKIVCSMIPLMSMALFITHPIGGAAYLYSMYWIIPAVIALLPIKSVFMAALGSTLTTHAIGSLMFLFIMPMNVHFWIALIPVVCVERCVYACGITVIHYACTTIFNLTSHVTSFFQPQTH